VSFTDEQKAAQVEKAKAYLDYAGTVLKGKGVALASAAGFAGSFEENFAESVIRFAAEARPDLIVVSTAVRSYNGRWLFSGVVERLLNKAGTSILVLKQNSNK
jgi:nucleotide-binding universal stress UspA family protein